MPVQTRQDLSGRALRFAAAVLERHRRIAAEGPAHTHMAKQLFAAASSIGAQLEEGKVANSRRDMAQKYAIALREARETHYWLKLLSTDSKWAAELEPLLQESHEFIAMLTVSVKKLREPRA